MRVATSASLVLVLAVTTQAAVIRVPVDEPTIQLGINAALNGDIVLVAPGTYNERISLMGKSITLTSEEGPDATVIDGQNAGTVVSCLLGETRETMIQGFTITRGSANGVVCARSSPTFRDLRIAHNSNGYDGGGVYCSWAEPRFVDVVFQENTTGPSTGGGGLFIYASSVDLVGCSFSQNGPNEINCQPGSHLTLRDCHFGPGSAAIPGQALFAGGSTLSMDKCVFWNRVGPETVVDLANGEVAGIDSCSFSDNATSGQPCLMLLNSHLTATHCVFERNSSTSGAGALCLGSQSSADIISCAFRNNAANATSGGGGAASASNDCSARFVDCTFLQDSAGGGGALDWLDSTLELHRCLFAGATATYWGGAVRLHRATALIESCTFYACSCTDNPTGGVVAMSGGSDVTIGASIVAFSTSSGIYADLNSFPAVSYCDVFACQGGLYSGAIPDLTGHNGNISADPLFCGASQGDFTIDASSPCAGTAPDGGDIGAFGVGCGAVVVEPLSWGRIKAMFR